MNLVTGNIRTRLTGILNDHFDTFSKDESGQDRNIIVFKEPKTVVKSTFSSNPYAGYGESSNLENVEYTQISGVFPAIVRYNSIQDQSKLLDLQTRIPQGDVTIKVKENARSFINDGKTECIQVDGIRFNVASTEAIQNYLGLKFYIYHLEVAK